MTSKLTRKNGEGTNVALRRRIDNLKNTHAGAHRRVPLQPYIRGMVHTSELRCMDHPYIAGSIVHTSEDGQYLSIHWSSDVQTCIPTYGYVYTIQKGGKQTDQL